MKAAVKTKLGVWRCDRRLHHKERRQIILNLTAGEPREFVWAPFDRADYGRLESFRCRSSLCWHADLAAIVASVVASDRQRTTK